MADERDRPSSEASSDLARLRIAAQVACTVPELGWSVCEPLLVPLLMDLEVPTHFLSVGWLLSPTLGIVVQPTVGYLSDRYGRKPFVVLFTGLASLGLGLLSVSWRFPKEVAKFVGILSFGLSDISHDVLVTPTRAAMNDAFSPSEAEKRAAIMGATGKVIALFCALFLTRSNALFTASVLIGCCCVTQMILVDTTAGVPSLERSKSQTSISSRQVSAQAQTPSRRCGCTRIVFPKGFWLMWLMQFSGWVALMVFYFYFTSACAELFETVPGTPEFDEAVHYGVILMFLSTGIFMAIGIMLPKIVRFLGGAMSAMVISCGMNSLICIAFTKSSPRVALIAGSTFIPIPYQIIANSPFAWLEAQPGFDEESRGRLTGWFNSAMACAQVVTALLSGPLMKLMGDRIIPAYTVASYINLTVFLFASVYLASSRVARRQSLRTVPNQTVVAVKT